MTPDAQHEGDAAFSKLTEYCWKTCPVGAPHEAGCYDLREIACRAALRERDVRWGQAVGPLLDAMFVCYGGRKAMRGVWFKDSHDAVALYDRARALLEEAGK